MLSHMAVNQDAGLLDVGRVGGVAAVDGVVEHHGVFSHQVVDVARAAGQRDGLLGDRVEAEEHFLAVEDVELEQRRAGVGADLRVGVLDEAEAGRAPARCRGWHGRGGR